MLLAPELPFSQAQQAVIDDRNHSLMVSASAGAGKTAVLVERLARMIADERIPVTDILAMTFTEDAAREMKTRLKKRLEPSAQEDEWLQNQMTLLETADISTIHSFCLNLVQKYYYRLGISYKRANTIETGLKDQQALDIAFEKAMRQADPMLQSRMKLYLESFGKNEQDLQKWILKFIEIAQSKPDARAWMESCRNTGSQIEPWFYDWFKMRIQILMEIFEEVEEEVQNMQFPKADKQEEYLRLFEGKLNSLQGCMEALDQKKYMVFGHRFIEYIETTGKFTPTINKRSFAALQKDSRTIEKEIAEVLFSKEEYERIDAQTASLRKLFIDTSLKALEYFDQEKQKQEFLDFSDMEQLAWKLLQSSDVTEELKKRYQVILVDEYQDTNDLQESILSTFAREDNVFRVGDIKQSIYGFRQAKPAIMQKKLDHPGQKEKVLHLQENYRSSKHVIDFNNAFYEKLMNTPGLAGQFSDSDKAVCGLESQKETGAVPRFLYTCYGGYKEADRPDMTDVQARSLFRRNRYDRIAADIEQRVQNGEASYRDIAILSRSSTSHDELKSALESWGIRAVHHVKKGFYTNKAIQIILSALRLIQDRRDDISLMAVLGSPLAGYSQQNIVEAARNKEPGQSLYQALSLDRQGQQMIQKIKPLLALRGLPLSRILSRLYNWQDFYAMYTTGQDKTNLDLLMAKAAQAESQMDLQEFLQISTLEEDLDKTSEAIPFGKEEDAVRISTIHASKGLEYKIVYVLSSDSNPDMDAASPVVLDPDLGLSFMGVEEDYSFIQQSAGHLAFEHKRFIEDQQEKMRLLYVATTRAREQLILVDSIKNEEAYQDPMCLRALWANKGFTSWVFHTFFKNPGSVIAFDKKEGLLDRPNRGLKAPWKKKLDKFTGDVPVIQGGTASAAKQNLSWKNLEDAAPGSGSVQGRARGTLFHEMAEQLEWPYQKEQAKAYALKQGIELSEEDLDQFLSLNQDAAYAAWKKLPHQYECPYAVFDGTRFLHGYMDMIAQDGDTVHILDFKSDRVFDMDALKRRYREQLETYRRAMQLIYPHKKVQAWIYSFYMQEMGCLEPE